MVTVMNNMSHIAICYLIITVVHAHHLLQNSQQEKEEQIQTIHCS